jgi:predicted CoA-binding protein
MRSLRVTGSADSPEPFGTSGAAAAVQFARYKLEINSNETIKKIIGECKTIAVVGLSSDPERSSFGVASYMRRKGYKVIPVNPNEKEVFGDICYAALSDVPEQVDLVDIFRRSSEAGKAVDEAIAIGAKGVWLQEGVIDKIAAERAAAAGLLVVMDRCWLKEHLRLHR